MGLFNLFRKYEDRPRIKIEPTAFDKILEALALVFLLLLLVMVLQHYTDLPEKIPTQFDNAGAVIEYGSKHTILILPTLGVVIFIMMLILNRFPHKFNYLVKITPQNAPQQYRLGTSIIRFANLFVMGIFYYTSYKIVNISLHQTTPTLDKWFVPLVLGIAIFGTISIYIVSLIKNKKQK